MDPTETPTPETSPETPTESGAGTFVRPDPFLYDLIDEDSSTPATDEGDSDGNGR